MYIPIQTLVYCFALGIFDDKEEAKDAYMEYLTSHENFEKWFETLKVDFNKLFSPKLSINRVEDFMQIIFDEKLHDKLTFEESEDMTAFWEGRSINAGDVIREVSDECPQRDIDAMSLAAHLDFSYDERFGNHASNLFFSIAYRSENKFTCNFDNYIAEMAKTNPLF